MSARKPDLVGTAEVAERRGVNGTTVSNWRVRRGDFPVPLYQLRCGPIWDWDKQLVPYFKKR